MSNTKIYALEPYHRSRRILISERHGLGPYPRFIKYCEPTNQINVGYNGFSVGAKLRYMGYFASLLHPPGRKSWLLFPARDMSGGLRNPCFTKFSVVRFL